MTELEAIALAYGVSLEDAKNIYVDDIPDDVYDYIIALMNGEQPKE